MLRPAMSDLRRSAQAMCLGVAAWAAGCAAQKPMIEPYFAARTYTPARIALLPPDVFAVYDTVGDNDPQRSAALGRAVTEQTARAVAEALQARGYQVDFSARWDGVHAPDGSLVLGGDELGWMANS